MHLSRIKIVKFRNFADLDVRLAGNVVIVGENRVGKSNLLYALRLIFDPGLPDSARELPSRPGEFHPEPLTDPDLTLSRHPARATA
jgi:predicted ATP-dependent endonuclease of OLD family